MMVAIVVIGVVLVGYSRQERLHPPVPAADKVQPTLSADWTEGISFDLCGVVQPALAKSPTSDNIGIKTSGSGVINLEPLTAADTGHHATLGRFASHYPGLTITAKALQLPKGKRYTNGQTCEGKPGQIQVETWSNPTKETGTRYKGNPQDLLLENGQLITVAFLPEGASIPKPGGTTVTAVLDGMTAAAQKSETTTTQASTATTTAVTVPVTSATTATTAATTATTTATTTAKATTTTATK